jgi:16S rRNA (uracil1498-N3)-methyltransferase
LAAALTLALCVYTLGPISGCHINPAITLGLWSIGKIKSWKVLNYIVAQVLGAGAAAIWPLLTRRTVKTGVKRERLQLIAKEAAEQSGRGTVPQVREPLALEAALEEALAAGTAWFFETGPDVRSVRMGASGEAFVFIGPEGGWDPEEAEKARRAGCEVISLGPRILRAETAAAVACWEALRG